MLPKSKKSRKSAPSSQLDLISSIDLEKRSQRHRVTLIIALGLTIGISFLFWTVYRFKTMVTSKTFPNIDLSLPSLNLESDHQPATSTLQIDLTKVPGFNSNHWSIWVSETSTDSAIYSLNADKYNSSQIKSFVSDIRKSSDSVLDGIDTILPSGVDLKLLHLSVNPYDLNLVITTPQKQLFLQIKIIDSANLDNLKPLVPQIVESIYWSVFNPN